MLETEEHLGLSAQNAAAVAAQPLPVILLHTPRGTQRLALPLGVELTLGRAPECDVHIDDPALSRVHAKVSRAGSLVSITDLGSRNGTWLGDRRVDTAFIGAGASVSMGGSVLAISTEAIPGAEASAFAADQADLRKRLRSFERDQVLRALEETCGNQRAAAERLGLPLRTFERRLHGIRKQQSSLRA
jgi:pSer/pThr/pTyr-binding forkhead associated (FHA) protein